jgi:hypothetical protein
MDAVMVVTFAGIAPVADEDATVGRCDHVNAAEPRIREEKGIGIMARDKAAALAVELLNIQTPAMEIDCQQFVVPSFRPLTA